MQRVKRTGGIREQVSLSDLSPQKYTIFRC